MLEAPMPQDEEDRLYELQCMQILDTLAEERFDRITRTAKRLFGVPISLVTLVDSERQWFKSRQGLQISEAPRATSFCGHAILKDDIFVIEDALADPRFADNPAVTGPLRVRFYAGAPLKGPNGHRVGSMCVIDHVPRTVSAEQLAALRDLADMVEAELNNVRLNQALMTARQEVSRRMEAQAQLQEAARREHELVTTIAHELRTPLTSIRGSLGLLASTGAQTDPAETDRMLAIALRNANRLSDLVNDFLDMERIASNSMPFHLQLTAVTPLVARAIEDNAGFAEGMYIPVVLKESVPEAFANLDEHRFLQVMSNLLSNAVKFSPAGATVEVSIHATGEHIKVQVRDCGPGIPEGFATTLFQRFARADTSDSREKGGTGLGLAITKALVEGMNGVLGYTTPPGGGTIMTVRFPRVRTDEPQHDR